MPKIYWSEQNFTGPTKKSGLNSVDIELFVNMGYFINVFFVDKLFFTAESRSTA
jgi:hypothetical protein